MANELKRGMDLRQALKAIEAEKAARMAKIEARLKGNMRAAEMGGAKCQKQETGFVIYKRVNSNVIRRRRG